MVGAILLDLNLHNDTLLAVALIVIIVCGVVWLLGALPGPWRH